MQSEAAAKELVSFLKAAGYPAADSLDPASLEWALDAPATQSLFHWLLTSVSSTQCISPSDMRTFRELETSGSVRSRDTMHHTSSALQQDSSSQSSSLLSSNILPEDIDAVNRRLASLCARRDVLASTLVDLQTNRPSASKKGRLLEDAIEAKAQQVKKVGANIDSILAGIQNKVERIGNQYGTSMVLAEAQAISIAHREEQISQLIDQLCNTVLGTNHTSSGSNGNSTRSSPVSPSRSSPTGRMRAEQAKARLYEERKAELERVCLNAIPVSRAEAIFAQIQACAPSGWTLSRGDVSRVQHLLQEIGSLGQTAVLQTDYALQRVRQKKAIEATTRVLEHLSRQYIRCVYLLFMSERQVEEAKSNVSLIKAVAEYDFPHLAIHPPSPTTQPSDSEKELLRLLFVDVLSMPAVSSSTFPSAAARTALAGLVSALETSIANVDELSTVLSQSWQLREFEAVQRQASERMDVVAKEMEDVLHGQRVDDAKDREIALRVMRGVTLQPDDLRQWKRELLTRVEARRV